MSFIVGGVYHFDSIYESCPYKVMDSECQCNNGYLCSRKDNSEICEHGINKCYSFSCPIVNDGASIDDINEAVGDYDNSYIDALEFDDEDITIDNEQLIVLIEQI